jgi:hypothetical protein
MSIENHDFILKSNIILLEKKLLKEDDEYGGNLDGYPSSGLFAIFAKPLADIFSAMKLTAMDISNALQLIVKSINNVFDPQKIERIKSEYNLKKSKILTKWKPIIQSSLKSIETADPFVTMALSPYLFMATKSLSNSIAAGKTAAEILAGEEWDGIRSKINRYPDVETSLRATADASRRNTAAVERLNANLHKLFFGKTIKKESVLREQKDVDADVKQFFEESGINTAFNDTLSEILDVKSSLIKELLPQVTLSSELLSLRKIKVISQFKKEIENLNLKDDIKKESINNLNKFLRQIEEKAKVLSKDVKFKNELINNKSLNLKEENVTEELMFTYAMNLVFESSKLRFDNENLDHVKQLVKWIKENKSIFVDDKDFKKISERKDEINSADNFIKIYTKFISLYKKIESAG